MFRVRVTRFAGVCVLALLFASCAVSPSPNASPSPSADWTPPEPSFGARVYPGAEYMPKPDREPGEYTRSWVQVYGGKSYCSTREEFVVVGKSYKTVVAWYRSKLDDKGFAVADEPTTEFVERVSKTATVRISVTKATRSVLIEFEEHDSGSTMDDCKTTFRIHS